MNSMDSGRLTLIKRELQRFKGIIEKLLTQIENQIKSIDKNNLLDVFDKHFQTDMIEDDQYTAFVKDFQGFLQVKNNQLTTFDQEYQNLLQSQTVRRIKQNEIKMIELQQCLKNIKTHPAQLNFNLFSFSQKRMNSDIALIDESTIKKSKEQTLAMAFANQGFDPSNQSYEFAFNIQVKAQWVAVGVGNDEGDQISSYTVKDTSKLGNGQYLISFHNYMYHHTDENINYKNKGMSFKVGDKIKIRYDHLIKILEFRKESDQTMVKMAITDMSKILYPCALLHYPGDQVQLVEY